LESASGRWSDAAAANPDDPLGAVIGFYLSGDHRGEKMDGCPIVALGSDAARQGPDVKAAFEAGIKAHLDVLGRFIGGAGDEASRGKAMAILATMVGAVTLSRVVNDPDLAQSLLDAAAKQVRDAAAA
jgi:TetR/AcrR family transcriptional repressor of nem operon